LTIINEAIEITQKDETRSRRGREGIGDEELEGKCIKKRDPSGEIEKESNGDEELRREMREKKEKRENPSEGKGKGSEGRAPVAGK